MTMLLVMAMLTATGQHHAQSKAVGYMADKVGVSLKVAQSAADACISMGVPESGCLILVATLAESGGKAYPTCGASAVCMTLCGSIPDGLSRDCRIQCMTDSAPNKAARVRRCNDRGKSKGWYQLRDVNLAVCKRHGLKGDPHDIVAASRCYTYLVRRSYRANACELPPGEHRWAVSFARVAAGVYHRGTKRQRCSPHGYAKRGLEAAERWNFLVASP